MKAFDKFFLEYAHDMGIGGSKLGIHLNKKGGNLTIDPSNRKIMMKQPEYKPQLSLGQQFVGNMFADILMKLFNSTESYDNFQENKILTCKNSDLGLQCRYINNQPAAIVIKVK